MRILFIIPKITFGKGYQPHTGVAYLVALLKKHRISTKVLDMQLGYSFRRIYKILDEFSPDIVGVTAYSYGYKRAYELVDKIKNYMNCTIVIGGPHISTIRDKVLAETKADFAIKGEGEYTLLELCRALKSGSKNYKEIKGLIWRPENKIIENPDRLFITDLDALPFPAYEEFELKKYICNNEKRLPIITSRGCPYRCIFCSVRLSMGNRFRARSTENVVNEIEYWWNKGWRNFDFNDDCFTLDLERAKKICDLIIERGLKITYQLYNGIRADRVSKELLQKMKKSGCTRVYYGCESGNPEILKRIKKGITLEQVKNAVKLTNEVGMECVVTFIIGHPYESFRDAMETVIFAKMLPASFVVFYNLAPFPGTELFEWVQDNATLLYPTEVYLNEISHGRQDRKPIFETKDFTAEERKKALKIGFTLTRKKTLQYKLGMITGHLAYLLAKSDAFYDLGLKVFLGTRVGKKLYSLVRRGT